MPPRKEAATAWSYARGREARAVVRRAVVEALADVCRCDPSGEDGREVFGDGARALAGEVLRRLGLAPIGAIVAAEALRQALEVTRPGLPEGK